MPNANQGWQSQRPQPVYAQNIDTRGGSRSAGFLAGQLPGIIQMVGAAKDLITGTAADRYNDANANAQKQRDAEILVDRLSKMPMEHREAALDAAIAVNPSLAPMKGKFDFSKNSLTFTDPAAQLGYENFKEISRMNQEATGLAKPGQPAVSGESAGPTGIGAEAGAKAAQVPGQQQQGDGFDFGQWANTQAPVAPTEVYSGQGEPPVPDGQYLQSTDDPKGPQTEVVDPPAPTEVDVSKPVQDDPDTALRRSAQEQMAANGYNIPIEKFWVSPQTGEVNLDPSLASKYPEFGPGAFEDVVAADPIFDPKLKAVVDTYAPQLVDNTRRVVQLNAGIRFARAYQLGTQPDYKDAMLAAGSLADIDVMLANLKVETGFGYDPKVVNPQFMQDALAWGQWLNPATDPKIRDSPEVQQSIIRMHQHGAEHLKLGKSLAEQYAKNSMSYAEFQQSAKNAQALQDLKDREIQADREKAQLEFTASMDKNRVGEMDANANMVSANARSVEAAVKAAQALTPEEVRAKTKAEIASINNLASQRYEGAKKLRDENLVSPAEKAVFAAAGKIAEGRLQTQSVILERTTQALGSVNSAISRLNTSIPSTVSKLPTSAQAFANAIILNNSALTDADRKQMQDYGVGAQQIIEIQRLKDQINGLEGDRVKLSTIFDNTISEMQKEKDAQPPQKQAQYLKDLWAASPVLGERLYEKELIRSLNHKAAGTVFDSLNEGYSDDKSLAELKAMSKEDIMASFRNPEDALYIGKDVITDAKLMEVYDSWMKWMSTKEEAKKTFTP